jgi:hypothetical protein
MDPVNHTSLSRLGVQLELIQGYQDLEKQWLFQLTIES